MARALLAWTVIATLTAAAVGRNDTAGPDRCYEAAEKASQAGAYAEAVTAWQAFVHDFPTSPRAAEALYQLAVACTLAGRQPDAQEAYDRLVKDYFTSPWAQFVLAVHLDADKMGALADRLRGHGCHTHQAAKVEHALNVYQLYRSRFLDGPATASAKKTKNEVAYAIADCHRLLGHDAEARGILAQLRDQDKDGKWGKLAALRLGDEHTFQDRLEELIDIDDPDSAQLFLELADKYLGRVKGEQRVKCLFYRAHCLDATERGAEALALYHRIEADYPASPYAAEAAFVLAEELFDKGDVKAAKAAYLHVAQAYPHSARAALARQWAAWADEMASSWPGVEEVLAHLILTASGPFPPLTLTVDCQWGDGKKTLHARLAYRDDRHLLLQLAYGPSGFLIANNAQGAWFQAVDQTSILHAKEPVGLPIPGFVVTLDQVKKSLGVNFACGDQLHGAPPSIQMPTSLASYTAEKLRSAVHLHRLSGPKAQVVYRMQTASWRVAEPATFDLVVDGAGMVRELRCTRVNRQGERTACTLSGISVGEQLPDGVFEFKPPAGTPVREVEQVNPMDVLGQLMRLGGSLFEQAKQERKKG
jgi:outer membrane protein assembly factor BamD (BamD/ComL family)